MTDFGSTPTSTRALVTNQFPVSASFVPGTANGDMTAIEGIAINTDANGFKSTAIRLGSLDGDDATQGAKSDVAVTGDNPGTHSAKLRGLNKVLASVWDSPNHWLQVKVMNATSLGQATMQNSAPVAIASDQTTLPVSGTLNAGTGTFTNQQSNVQADYDTTAGTQNLTMFGMALPASGGAVAGGTSSNPLRTDPTGTTTQPVSGTVTANQGGSNWSTNTVQLNGTTIDTNSGTKSAGTQRVVLATDQPALTNALKVDGSAVTQPVSGTITANAGTGNFNDASVGASGAAVPASASYLGGNKSGNLTGISLDASGNLNVNVAAGGAAGGTSSSFNATFPATGTATGASDGTNMKPLLVDASGFLKVNISAGGGSGGTSSSFGSAFPATGTASGFSDGTNMQGARAFDADTGAGTQYVAGASLRISSSGGSIEAKGQQTMTNSIPVTLASDQSAVSITANSSVNVAQVAGTTTDTNSGNKSAGTQRVVIATDQPQLTNALKVDGSGVTQPVSGTITANGGTGPFPVAGMVASGASNANNPVKVGGAFNTTQPTVTTGQVVDAQYSARGAALVATGTDTFNVTVNAALPTGSNVIGHVIADSGSTTAVTQTTASNLNAQVQGAAASGAAQSGNPVKVGGVFNTTQPTVTTGQAVDTQMTARGAQIVATGTDTFNVTVNAALPTGGNTIGAVTQASGPWTSNVTQFGGNNVATGTGASGTGIPRVTVSNDSQIQVWDGTTGPVAAKAAGTPPTLADISHVHSISPNNTGLPVNTSKIVQKTNNKSSGSVASLAVAFGSNNVAGNSIVVVCAVGNGTAPTITDTLSNTYTQAVQIANGTALNTAVFSAVNIASGANTVTVNNGGTTASIAMEIYEVSGLITQVTAQPSITASATGSSGTASTSNVGALSPNEYAFAGVGVGTAAQTITAGSGWTNDSGQQNPTTPAGLFSFVSMSQFLGSLKAVTPQATFTSEPWAIAVATFRPVLFGIEGTVNQAGAATGTKSNVASSASSVTLLAANASRKNAMIYNDSTQILYLDLSGGTASNSSYSTQVGSNVLFELPGPAIYTGAITGIWAAANGNGRITEFS